MDVLDALSIRVINAAHRVDRRQESLAEFARLAIPVTRDVFFNAKFLENAGGRGCALSHAMALSEFLFHEDKPFALILEDDFSVRDAADFLDPIGAAITQAPLWDVFLVGHNQAVPTETTSTARFQRVVHAQTTSGYVVGRAYASTLIQTFFRSAEHLRRYAGLPSPNREFATQLTLCDVLWKELQLRDRFWAPFPSLIYQRRSYSDIEKRVVDYQA